MSIAQTVRTRRASGKVNHPSPQQRSTTSMPGLMPTAKSTLAGSGHKASHHPGSGIPVPSKNPDIVMGIQAASVGGLFHPPASQQLLLTKATISSGPEK